MQFKRSSAEFIPHLSPEPCRLDGSVHELVHSIGGLKTGQLLLSALRLPRDGITQHDQQLHVHTLQSLKLKCINSFRSTLWDSDSIQTIWSPWQWPVRCHKYQLVEQSCLAGHVIELCCCRLQRLHRTGQRSMHSPGPSFYAAVARQGKNCMKFLVRVLNTESEKYIEKDEK